MLSKALAFKSACFLNCPKLWAQGENKIQKEFIPVVE
jgi:hypothetical protein